MAAPLKVFTWSDGFHRYTVAASSRAKALGIWGFSRDLFKTGDAQQITSGGDYQAALDSPGVSVERGLSIDTDKVVLKKATPPKAAQPAGPRQRDLQEERRLQAELEAAIQAHDAARADLDRRRAALDGEAERLETEFRAQRRDLTRALDAARRKAGA